MERELKTSVPRAPRQRRFVGKIRFLERARIGKARHRGVVIAQASPVALSVLVSVGGVRPRSPDVG